MRDCPFQHNSDGLWQCPQCNWTYKLKADKPPRRNCPRSTKINSKPKGLGDRVEQALTTVGVTSERVERWLGRPCSCDERKEKLNRLGNWVVRILSGKTEKAEEYLNQIIGDDDET